MVRARKTPGRQRISLRLKVVAVVVADAITDRRAAAAITAVAVVVPAAAVVVVAGIRVVVAAEVAELRNVRLRNTIRALRPTISVTTAATTFRSDKPASTQIFWFQSLPRGVWGRSERGD